MSATAAAVYHSNPPTHKQLTMKNLSILKSLFLCPVFLLAAASGYNGNAQTPSSPADCKTGCTSNDVQIIRAYLVDPTTNQQLSGSFSCSGTVSVKLALELTTNTPRVGVVIYANIKNFTGGVVGTTLVTKKECFGASLNQPTNKVVFSGAFGWSCGTPIVLTDVFLGWGTGNTDFCSGSASFRCPGTPSKCFALPEGQYIAIQIPTAQNVSRSRCPDAVGGSTATFNLTALNGEVSNNATNVTITWYSNSGLSTQITTPGAFSTAGTTVYAKVTNNADANVYSTATVTLTVLPGAVLSISNPAAVCAPATVDITAAGVTTGSTLPSGTTISYWSDAGATTSLSTPAALGSGTYYIKAATNSTPSCADIKAVTVTVHARPTLSVTNPAAICSPATADLTAAAVTTGSTLPQGTALSYWTNAQASSSLATPAAAGNGTYYIKAATNTTPTCSDIQPVVVTVHAKPTLSITAPAAVCAPATVDLTNSAVTSGSTLPTGTNLSYWTNSGATSSYTTPAAAGNGTYYIKAITNTTPACSDIQPVTVTVHAAPVLSITNPAALCAPATVNLTAAAITTGSTLPTGTNLSYWTNSGATISVSTPTAVGNGTYYIKATTSTTPACSDVEAVTVTVNSKPDAPALCAVQPSMCGPATGTLTVTSPTGGSYQYSIDNGQHWQSAVTFSNIAPASNPSILVKDGTGCVSSAANCSSAGTCATARTTTTAVKKEQQSLIEAAPTEDELSVKVYPNPYRNTVNFTFTAPVSGKVVLEVYDNTGRQSALINYGDVMAGTTRVFRYTPRQKLTALQLYRVRIGNKTVSGKMIQGE
jgi:hypothetical protein